MKGHIRITAATDSVTNLKDDGTKWLSTLQVTAVRSRAYKISVSNLLAGTDLYLWIFDLAAGTGASAAPVHVRYLPQGLADTWDLGTDGAIFKNGIYLAVGTNNAATPATTVTDAGDNCAIIKAEYAVTNF